VQVITGIDVPVLQARAVSTAVNKTVGPGAWSVTTAMAMRSPR
jgi:hypothetical protein